MFERKEMDGKYSGIKSNPGFLCVFALPTITVHSIGKHTDCTHTVHTAGVCCDFTHCVHTVMVHVCVHSWVYT